MIEQIYFNGTVLTQDHHKPVCSAFAVSNGKIAAVGDDSEILSLKGESAKIEDLKGKAVVPGFNDAHIHIWKVGNLLTYMLDVRGAGSIDELQQRLLDFARRHPEAQWIQARGFNEAQMKEQRIPDRRDLDSVIADKPVMLIRTCAHQIVVNTKALEATGITRNTVTPAGGEIMKFENGEPSGHFTETALGLVMSRISQYTFSEYRKMILTAQERLLQLGITSATDPAVMPDLLDVYKSMDKNGELKIRVNAIAIRLPDGASKPLPLPQKYETAHLKIDTVKFFADGGLSGKTAAVSVPYKNSTDRGVLRLEKSEYLKLAFEAQSAGFRIATHAIGDVAVNLTCDVAEELWNQLQVSGNRIEHLGLPSAQNLEQMERMKMHAVMQPVFLHELGRNFREYLDEHRLSKVYPIKSVLNAGINLSLSTDAPVVSDMNPFRGIQSAMLRRDADGNEIGADEKISFSQALHGYTAGSALANSDFENRGSVEAGKHADFFILSNDPRMMKADELSAVMPEAVFTGGNRVITA